MFADIGMYLDTHRGQKVCILLFYFEQTESQVKNLAITTTGRNYSGKEAVMESRHEQSEELKEILYDEAFKLLNDHDKAKALTEEIFLDFVTCHTAEK